MQTGKLKRHVSPSIHMKSKKHRRSSLEFKSNCSYSPHVLGANEVPNCHRISNSVLDANDAFLNIEPEDDTDHKSVNVAVRIRPFTRQELQMESNKNIIRVSGNNLFVESNACNDAVLSETKFEFDHCLWSFSHEDGIPFASQEMVYDILGNPLLDKAIEGYNTCLFAYGMTSSGKSFSIVGTRNEEGIIPRISADIFERLDHSGGAQNNEIKIEICFYEIYNEKIRDLFIASHDKSVKRRDLRVREHPEQGPYVEGLTTYAVRSHEDVRAWISLATKRRATASTSLNEQSSRSHAVFVFVIHKNAGGRYLSSKINIVDLAGCERLNSAGTTGLRQKEGSVINRSLLTLGRIISMLAEHGSDAAYLHKERKIHIPYRDSTLTWLLKESLGGNSQTTMLTTISPSSTVIEETVCTLRYAAKARHVVNCARIFEDPTSKIIRELRAEIKRLVQQKENQPQVLPLHINFENEMALLRKTLASKEEEMEAMKKSWLQEKSTSDRHRREALSQLENRGVMSPSASSGSRSLGPHGKKDQMISSSLINLHSDPLLNETLVYPIRVGDTLISNSASHESIICLGGPLIAERHCLLKYVNGTLRIEPLDLNSGTFVNGQWIEKETTVYDGDRIVFGDHYFRVQLPSKMEMAPEVDSNFMFNRAKMEHLRGQEIRGQWLLMKQRAESEIERLNELVLSREERIRYLEAELMHARTDKIHLEAKVKLETKEEQVQNTPEKTEDIGCDCSFISDKVSDDHNELTLWTKITEANQICKKIGIKAYFFFRPNISGPCYVKLNNEESGKSSIWSIETFTDTLNDLRNAWEMDSDPDVYRNLIYRDENCSLLEHTPSVSETSMNFSFIDNPTMSPLIHYEKDEKDNDPERLIRFIHVVRECTVSGIRQMTDLRESRDGRWNAINHLSELFKVVQEINPYVAFECSANLSTSLLKLCYHLLVSMGILLRDIQEENELRLLFRKLGNSIEVLCTNLRYQVRNLQSYVVEEKTESRVLEIIETFKKLFQQSDLTESIDNDLFTSRLT